MPAPADELLAEWEPVIPCDLEEHEAGTQGCIPGTAGTQVVQFLHKHPERPAALIVCVGHAAWLMPRLTVTVRCRVCGHNALMCDFITFAGTI